MNQVIITMYIFLLIYNFALIDNMKTFLIFICIIFGTLLSYSGNKYQYSGVINDINKSESKILFSIKEFANEAYSRGSIKIFDINSCKEKEIYKIKSVDYNIKSYFIKNDSIIILTNQSIYLYDIEKEKIIKNIKLFNANQVIVSTAKISDIIYFTVIDYVKNRLSYHKLNSEFNITTEMSTDVKVIPTDNFFNIFALSGKLYKFENGILKNLKNEKNVYRIAFNDINGDYLISCNQNSLCFVEKNKAGYFVRIITDFANKQLLNIKAIKDLNKISILPIYNNNRDYYYKVYNKYFSITKDGTLNETIVRTLFDNNRYSIDYLNINKFEIIIK